MYFFKISFRGQIWCYVKRLAKLTGLQRYKEVLWEIFISLFFFGSTGTNYDQWQACITLKTGEDCNPASFSTKAMSSLLT